MNDTYVYVGEGRFEITRRLSQSEAGRLMGVSRQHAAAIETKALAKIAFALGVNPGASPLVTYAQRRADPAAAARYRRAGRAEQAEAKEGAA